MNLQLRRLLRNYSFAIIYSKIGFFCLVFPGFSHGQSIPLSNPSMCPLHYELKDNSCPENNLFYHPDTIPVLVSGEAGTTLGGDVFLKEVHLVITHEWAGDLDITLVSPAGKRVLLSSDNGGGDDNYGDPGTSGCLEPVVFSMASCRSVENGTAPFTDGPYRPEESLYAFNDGITNPNGTWQLFICDDVPVDTGRLEFVQLIFENIDCLPVESVHIKDLDGVAVTIDWVELQSGTVVIEYGPPGFVPGNGTTAGQGIVVPAGGKPFLLTNLAAETEYEAYVRKICGNNSSGNSCPVTFVTGCAPPAVTLLDHFDTLALNAPTCGETAVLPGFWQNSLVDDFDWLVFEGETPTPGTGPSMDVSGAGKYIYLEASGLVCNDGNKAILTSKCLQMNKQGTDTCHFSFYYHQFGSEIGSLSVETSIDGGGIWQKVWSQSGDQGNSWKKIYLSFDHIADGTVYQVRFIGVGGSGSRGDIALDQIAFHGSVSLGDPDNLYFRDIDGDGYGEELQVIGSCLASPPPGFVTLSGDCDDNNPAVNPGSAEIPCDGIDNNCSGNLTDDDYILPAPAVTFDTICSGGAATVCATPAFGKPVFWYHSAEGSDFAGFGDCLFIDLPENTTSLPVVYKFYAEETDFVCRSAPRAEAIVVVNPAPLIEIGLTPDICPGEEVDLASIAIEDGRFTGGEATLHEALPANNSNRLDTTIVKPKLDNKYYVLMTNPYGCQVTDSFSLLLKPGPSITFSPADSFGICREQSVEINALASGGQGPYRFFWETGAESSNITVESAFLPRTVDSYALTVTGSDGCFTADSVIVRTTTSIESLTTQVVNVSACNAADGAITLTPLGGTPPFRYQWSGSNGSSGDTTGISGALVLTGLAEGAYRATITDNSPEACAFLVRQILVNGPNAIIGPAQIDPLSCYDAGDGKICLDVQASDPQYLWNTGDTTLCIDSLPSGFYSVTITVGACETVLADLWVGRPDSLKITGISKLPLCHDTDNGSIAAQVFGGQGPYAYQWSNGMTRKEANGLPAGIYSLTATDLSGCTQTSDFLLTAPFPLQILVDSIRHISCNGLKDGYLQVSGVGGTAPYSYQWSSGGSSRALLNQGPGIYTLTITDFNGCIQTQSFEILEPADLVATLQLSKAPICIGDTTGFIQVSGSGGVGPYNYLWEHGPVVPTIGGLGTGIYVVEVVDKNGCKAPPLEVALGASSPLKLEAGIRQPSCVGLTDGGINIIPAGPGPFFFSWNTGDTIGQLNGLGIGKYDLTLTDQQGCLLDTSFLVDATQVFVPSFSVLDPSCFNSSDGLINVAFIQAGTAPFIYQWNNGSVEKDLIGLTGGAYSLTISDNNGCTFLSDTFLLKNPDPIELDVLGIGAILCNGDQSGFIEIEPSGGTPPYTYDWTGTGLKSKNLVNLGAGQYRLLLKDQKACPYDAAFEIIEPQPLLASIAIEYAGNCTVNTNTTLRAEVTGGVLPYKYRWSTSDTLAQLRNVNAGDYGLTVTDRNGCSFVVPSTKVRPPVQGLFIDSMLVKDITCHGAKDGQITVNIQGGSPPFRFHFSNNHVVDTDQRVVTCYGLAQGSNYSVTVTDMNNGCSVNSKKVAVREPNRLSIRRDSIRSVSCFGATDGGIFLTISGGTPAYSFHWLDSLKMAVGYSEDLTGIGGGIYEVIVNDARLCADTLSNIRLQDIGSSIVLIDSLTRIRDVSCNGEQTGFIELTVKGGQPPYNFLWNNNRTTEDIRNLPAGNYQLTVTDAKSCKVSFPEIVINEPLTSVTASSAVSDPRCFGLADGSIEVTLFGGIKPFQITWRKNDVVVAANTLLLKSITAGVYQLSVIDSSSCRKNFFYSLEQPDSLAVFIEPSLDMPGKYKAVPNGGTPPYQYQWNTGHTTSEIMPALTGQLSVALVDRFQCTAYDSLLVVKLVELPAIEGVVLFPNPVGQGKVTLQVISKEYLSLNAGIHDPLGRIVSRKPLVIVPGENSFQLPLEHFTTGSYFITLWKEGQLVWRHTLLVTSP